MDLAMGAVFACKAIVARDGIVRSGHARSFSSTPLPVLRPDRIPFATSLVAVALLVAVGWAVSLIPATSWLDLQLLDAKFRINRALFAKPVHHGIVIVGADEGTLAAIAEPATLWHRPHGRAFTALAAARPVRMCQRGAGAATDTRRRTARGMGRSAALTCSMRRFSRRLAQ
jgi:hypothetical protein